MQPTPPQQDDPAQGTPQPKAKKTKVRSPRERRRRRILLICGGAVVGLLLMVVGGAYALQHSYNGQVERVEGALPTADDRPAATGRGENWMLIGSDRRADIPSMGARADALMIVHLAESGDRVSVVAIPRDSWVPIPGHGTDKINAAFAYGGPRLLIRTVEKLTGVRIDHYAALDFGGFVEMTDALGGVTVTITEDTYDPKHERSWRAGTQHLDGVEALDFVRQRVNLPNGDLDRIKRQQAFLEALAGKALDTRNPIKIDRFIRAVTGSVTVDETVTAATLRKLATRLLDVSLLEYVTTPVDRPAAKGKQSVILLDHARAATLFAAVRDDRIGEYVTDHGGSNAVDAVR
ncbi:LCP family protein [Actinomadura algeriensis]|uniref:LCP family protein required for cell wall assembly n=1 Tax=Actinomadura algeriensis TaxID=1679523 RepID=A0ABR9JUG4_9ACTN|nr:LCP family protein [Actinomadura algeriensis]MBE1534203.1 LCP family protein required for cell wall assembly [Actinomadura algeriensis]